MNDREIGALDARVNSMEREMKGLRADVREIRDALLTVRGGRKALLFLVGISASAGGMVAALMPAIFK